MEKPRTENSHREFIGDLGAAFATRQSFYGFHLPWPGLGVVIPNDRKDYQWLAESHRWDF